MGAASYRVETPEEIEAGRRRAARERYHLAAVRHAALVTESAAYRASYGRAISAVRRAGEPSPHASADDLEAAAARLDAEREQARAVLDGQLTEAFRMSLFAMATRPAPRVARRAPTASSSARQSQETRLRQERESAARVQRLAERAAVLLARLPAAAPAQLREACRADAAEIASASEQRARLVLASLEDRVRAAERTQRAVDAAAEQAAVLVARLRDVPGAHAVQLARRLTEVIEERQEEVPRALAAEVEQAVVDADAARTRRIAAQALARVLVDLDYHVAEGFETALVDQGTAVVGLPGEPGYGLKVLFDRGSSRLAHIVVRDVEADGGEHADRRAQQAFCDGLGALRNGLGRHHVQLKETQREEPGRRPVPRVAAGTVPRRDQEQAREHGGEREA
ncbi:hypothetical protein AB0A91_13355 [Streptomyces sp. NPDC042207]|uniref:hypothetical protein n=1 Tax=Streptomyces sp. NPDC042207 TaxID=3154331 RepID=UPI0033C8BC5E